MTTSKDNNAPIIDGTLLIAEDALLPEPSPQDSHSIGNGWARITNNLVLEKKLAAAGWSFFYMAGMIRSRVFGFERNGIMQTAVKRLLAKAASEKCNCLEIDHIAMGSFCGLPFVTVLAHSRHIQQSRSFCSANV
jgi:hypothetical protein